MQMRHSDIIEMGLTPILDFDEAVKMENVRALILTSPNDLHDQQIAQSVAEGKTCFLWKNRCHLLLKGLAIV